MSYFNDTYYNRLNRFGDSFPSRVQGEREAAWRDYRDHSTYQVCFPYNDVLQIGVLVVNKQDESQVSQWLETSTDLKIPNGTILEVENQHSHEKDIWLVMYLKDTKSKGYNSYFVIRTNQKLTWKKDGKSYSTYGYAFGTMRDLISDFLRSTGRNSSPVYNEPDKNIHIILPTQPTLRRDDILVIGEETFFITGYDILSNEGIEYISLTQTYTHTEELADVAATIENPTESTDTFWMGGSL